jgi:hypothetical protein
VHEGSGLSSTKTVATEERPFVEVEELKRLPNNVAIVLPSNGDRTLPAAVTFLRPLWVQEKHPELSMSTPWLDWPSEVRPDRPHPPAIQCQLRPTCRSLGSYLGRRWG